MNKTIIKVGYDKNKISSLIQILQQLNIQATESNIKVMETVYKIVQNWDIELTDEDLDKIKDTNIPSE